MSEFKTKLHVRLIDSYKGGIWELMLPFVYSSSLLKDFIIVPPGFVTDFASVPRVPFIYSMLGNQVHEAAVLHDWVYSPKCKEPWTREQADDVLYEAAVLSGIPKYKAWLIWFAVRCFGGQFYKAR